LVVIDSKEVDVVVVVYMGEEFDDAFWIINYL
jgi:hypothetical protein